MYILLDSSQYIILRLSFVYVTFNFNSNMNEIGHGEGWIKYKLKFFMLNLIETIDESN